jgi:hypothetical protein
MPVGMAPVSSQRAIRAGARGRTRVRTTAARVGHAPHSTGARALPARSEPRRASGSRVTSSRGRRGPGAQLGTLVWALP